MASDLPFTAAVEAEQEPAALRREAPKYPHGYEPGVTFDGSKGVVTTEPLTAAPNDWADVLRVWDLDPDVYEIVPPVSFSAWDSTRGGEPVRLYSYKANIRLRSKYLCGYDYDDLVKEMKKYKPKKKAPSGDMAFVVCLSDWQLGKGLEGGGSAEIIEALQDRILWIADRFKELRKIGRNLGTLYVVGMGDIIEACEGNYPQQLFTIDLNLRDQLKVARRIIRDMLVAWAPHFERVVVSAVPGNHGEAMRRNGKNVTDDADNHDVALFEVVAEIFAQNSAFDHVKFHLPNDEAYVVLNVAGTTIAFAHGHKAGSGTSPQKKQRDWWANMAFTEKAVGDASVLVTAHYHHLSVVDYGPKLHLQAPAMDCGSKWFEDRGGGTSKRGLLTFVVDPEGVRDLEVI